MLSPERVGISARRHRYFVLKLHWWFNLEPCWVRLKIYLGNWKPKRGFRQTVRAGGIG